MPGYAETQNLAALLLRGAFGTKATVGIAPHTIGVWPAGDTIGPKAEGVMIYVDKETRFMINAVANTALGGILHADVPYAFPLHPVVNSLSFISPTNTSVALEVTWLVTR